MIYMNSLKIRCFTLMLGLISFFSLQAESFWVNGFSYEFSGNEATVVGCSLSGDIVIPDRVTYNGSTYTVTTIGINAFYCHHTVTSIRIPNTVTTIKNQAFIYASLRSVYFPSSIREVEWYAFYDNPNLTSVFCMASTPPNWGEQGFGGRDEEGEISLYVPFGSVEAYQSAPYWEHFKNIYPIDTWDFVEDGIYYHISGGNNVVLIYGEPGFGSYSGSVVIPETVVHNGVSYNVTGFAASAFAFCNNLISLSIPVTISSIGNDVFAGTAIPSLFITGDGAWTAGSLDLRVNELFVGSGVTSIENMTIEASNIYSFAPNPPVCNDYTFLSYEGALHVPPTSFGSYFAAPYWNNFLNITGDANFVWPTSVELSQSSAILEIGEELELSATILPPETSYENISWSSTNTNVATVNDGVITAVSAGECDIIATSLTAAATCHIVVIEKKIHISLDQHTARVLPNHMITLTPTLTPISTDIIVSTSNSSVALARIADSKIQVAGIKEGTATITVNSADGYAFPDSCVITVYTERGDLNCDGYVTIADVTSLIDYLLTGDDNNVNPINADTDKDNKVSISDVTILIDYLLTDIWPWERSQLYTVNGVSFTMVPVEGGTFTMGATGEQGTDAYDTERPTHEVTLSSYCIGQTEVTQELWLAVMGSLPCDYNHPQCPVICIEWEDCQVFISKLNELTGMNFRLPTEAEWEYAARGGKKSKGYKYSGSDNIDDVAWTYWTACGVGTDDPDFGLHVVASKQPNELGLYDMSGNVWEICYDWYGDYSDEAQTNPTGPISGTLHVRRGGCWNNLPGDCRVSNRHDHYGPCDQMYGRGMRLAL